MLNVCLSYCSGAVLIFCVSGVAAVYVTHELEPIWDCNSRILILGTMPSPKSREAGFYYAHPQNRFWTTLSWVLGEETPTTNDGRRELALRYGIAIWDVLKCCDIDSASDASIKRPEANPIDEIIAQSRIEAVFTTGKKAFALYNKLCLHRLTELAAVCLPSTSPANCRVPEGELRSAYSQIRTALDKGKVRD